MRDAFAIQQQYYAETAALYDEMHVREEDEHGFALAILTSYLRFSNARTLLDIGSGTGRVIRNLKANVPGLKVVGIEPSAELRRIAHQRYGISHDELIDGNALNLAFPDNAFDVVCEVGALHHIAQPGRAVEEMLRVARQAIFISDCNNFGQGSWYARGVKQLLHTLGMWPLANWVRTRGKGYMVSDGDGLFYSYSVFNDYPLIRRACRSVHVINTTPGGINPYRTASHVALLGCKSVPL